MLLSVWLAVIGTTLQDVEVGSMARTLKGALAAGGSPMPLVPQPSQNRLDWSKPVTFSKLEGSPWLAAAMKRRFSGLSEGPVLKVTGKPGFDAEGFRITIAKTGITIEGNRGASWLVNLVQVRNGKLTLPTGTLSSQPATAWRGVHLFVGPDALDFHKKLWTRVLLPLGFNRVVLQCEQTEWNCLPHLRGGINMKRAELAELCDWYRSVGVEPIPLVQSFGHSEWLFEGGANLDLAFNKDVPYAVDPRKPGVKELYNKLWDEVIAVTKAKTIHFGLDEVDMRGFPKDPKLVTELWKIQVPMLGEIAKKHGVAMMLWGDKGLAKGEAPDGTHGDNPEESAARRAAIPKGAFIADWHYRADSNPATFMPSLLMWEREGFQPIAATWFEPKNIEGFTLAATAHGFGTLQTTWAGRESSEATMLAAMNQFTAMVLAGDYAWSGRDKTGYDPADLFRRLMYERPQSIKGEGGLSVVFGGVKGLKTLGPMKFLLCEPETVSRSLTIDTNFPAREIDLALNATTKAKEGEPVAKLTIETDGKPVEMVLRYGADVRLPSDTTQVWRGERMDGFYVVRVPLGEKDVRVKRIRLERIGENELNLHGITAI